MVALDSRQSYHLATWWGPMKVRPLNLPQAPPPLHHPWRKHHPPLQKQPHPHQGIHLLEETPRVGRLCGVMWCRYNWCAWINCSDFWRKLHYGKYSCRESWSNSKHSDLMFVFPLVLLELRTLHTREFTWEGSWWREAFHIRGLLQLS